MSGSDKYRLQIYPEDKERLLAPCYTVDIFRGINVSSLVGNMIAIMTQNNGIGIAAPQIGASYRVIVMGGECGIKRRVMIHPVLADISEEQSLGEEGCLSLPGVRANILRPDSCRVIYENEGGDCIEEMMTGLEARIVQHEVDHINSTLFIDRLKPLARKIVLDRYLRRRKRGE